MGLGHRLHYTAIPDETRTYQQLIISLGQLRFRVQEENQRRQELCAFGVPQPGRPDDEIHADARERDFGKKVEYQKRLGPAV